ncbi:hypothetical protein BpHYR1_030335, partial [Brachionus plicatilis]
FDEKFNFANWDPNEGAMVHLVDLKNKNLDDDFNNENTIDAESLFGSLNESQYVPESEISPDELGGEIELVEHF